MVNTTAIRDSGDAGGYHKNSGQSQVSRTSWDTSRYAAPMMGVLRPGPQLYTEVRVHQRNRGLDIDLGTTTKDDATTVHTHTRTHASFF